MYIKFELICFRRLRPNPLLKVLKIGVQADTELGIYRQSLIRYLAV